MKAAAVIVAAMLALPVHAAAPVAGDAAPGFTLDGRTGQVSLAAYKGKLVYLDFWASWCAPCKRSFPWMNTLQQRHPGLVVVAVNVDEKRADAEHFLAQVPASFTVAFEPSGALARQYALKGMPSSMLIGTDGRLIALHTGYTDEIGRRVEQEVTAALAAAK